MESRGGRFNQQPISGIKTPAQLEAEKKKKNAELAKRGLNPDGSPMRPKWEGISNADGTLKSKYQLGSRPDVAVDLGGYNAIRDMALRNPNQQSAWAQLATQKQQLEEANQRDMFAKQNATAQAQAASNLAMRGGIGQGAKASLAKQMARQQLMGNQDINRQGSLSRLEIGSQDENRRVDMLGKLTNLDAQKATLDLANRDYATNNDKWNITNMLQEMAAKRGWTQGVYQEEMKKWGAERTAQAQEKAAGSGGGGK